MTIKQLSPDQIESLVGSRHDQTGIEFPSEGMQPYYQWLMRTLHLLAESSAAAFRVAVDEGADTSVFIAPGRATIDGTVLAYDGGTIDLATHNNDTVYLWLEDDQGSASIGVNAEPQGWPTGAHIKLAEVTLAAGNIVEILDRRFETVLRV